MMLKTNIVYYSWTGDDSSFIPYESFFAPQNILRSVIEYNIDDEGTNFIKCPVFNRFARKTFNILSPIDFSFYICDNHVRSNHKNSKLIPDEFVFVRNVKLNCISLHLLNYVFFTETPCNMTWNNSYFSKGQFSSKVHVIPGQFDISRWFRNVDLAFIVRNKNDEVHIQRKEPVASVNFDFQNDDKIIFKRFDLNEKLRKYLKFKKILSYDTDQRPKFDKLLSYYYNLFDSSLAKKGIIKEIKRNILE